MLDVTEIQSTIKDLEDGDTTFDTCIKLAALYTVHDRLTQQSPDTIEKELNDILPQYKLYKEVKRKYQLHELNETAVYLSMQDVCKELKELIQSIYSGTDTEQERQLIKEMIQSLIEAY